MRAIQGVIAGVDTVSKELRKLRRKADPHTCVIGEVPLIKMYECTLWICLSEGEMYEERYDAPD